ncbi:hypothetical protein, partial [Klebsiella grimontii]|uniref:hypothetical protein n=1 Tax=Klebsiella grimontii TaxID=2058152 RepID=UPI0028528FFB
GHERTSKARIIHQIQLIRGITNNTTLNATHIDFIDYVFHVKVLSILLRGNEYIELSHSAVHGCRG